MLRAVNAPMKPTAACVSKASRIVNNRRGEMTFLHSALCFDTSRTQFEPEYRALSRIPPITWRFFRLSYVDDAVLESGALSAISGVVGSSRYWAAALFMGWRKTSFAGGCTSYVLPESGIDF